jgi:Zn finger protein HypA/HybF involved in hydrogenase expression
MSTQEYKCQDCSMEFAVEETCGQETTSEMKCPMCKGDKVRKLTGAEMLARLALGSMRSG